MAYTLQNFYKATLLLDWTIGTGNFYVSVKPTISSGWLVISPNNSSIREIIKYTATGTDSNGDYVTVSQRGVGGTTEQTHTTGEPIRMNLTAEYWAAMNADIAAIVASGVVPANTTTMGGVEIATPAEIDAGTGTGGTGAPLAMTPDNVNTAHNIPFVAPGTVDNIMKSNGTDWISAAQTPFPFIAQDIELPQPIGGAGNLQIASTQDGSVMYMAYNASSGSSVDIYRIVKDASGNYIITHSTTLSVNSNGLAGIAATSTYLYVMAQIGGVSSCRRYSLADLSGVTSMTGTQNWAGGIWSDGTNLYTNSSSNNFDKYTISGTALTNAATIAFTSAGSVQTATSNGTYMWCTVSTGAGTLTIKKYPIAGGAATSTTTYILHANKRYASLGFQFFIGGSSYLGMGWGFDTATPTTSAGGALHLMAITQP